MTKYCDLKPSATVTIRQEHLENIVTNNCPIEVTTNIVPSGGVIIKVYGDVEYGNAHNIVNNQENDPNGTRNDIYSLNFVVCSQSIGCGANSPNNQGEPYYQAQIYRNGVYTGLHFGTAGWYSVAITEVVYTFDKYRMQVFDKDNTNLYQQDFNNQPQYVVACGDDCPPGYCKCECINYPGYCCYDTNGYPLH